MYMLPSWKDQIWITNIDNLELNVNLQGKSNNSLEQQSSINVI